MRAMRVSVLKGGISAEREVSLRTGAAVAGALRGLGHDVTEVVVESEDFRVPAGCEAVFVALHGTFGEDGEVQRILEVRGVPYTGCGPESSARAFDKLASKRAFVAAGVPTPEFAVCGPETERPPLVGPMVVKPPRQGSSVGVTRLGDPSRWREALAEALRFDDPVLVERMVIGRELTVGILGDEALPVVEIVPREGFYDYANKYTAGRTEYRCPAPLPAEVTGSVRAAALAAHRSLGCEIYSRVDVLLDESGAPWVLEVNTIPGMTETSLLPKAAAAAGLPFPALCEKILSLSLELRGGAESKRRSR